MPRLVGFGIGRHRRGSSAGAWPSSPAAVLLTLLAWPAGRGLRPVADPDDRFDSARVGLDHVSFTVSSRAALDDAIQRLDEHQIPHGEVQELIAFGIAILSFQDPDGIHLELTAAL